jgi:hypothetical protein
VSTLAARYYSTRRTDSPDDRDRRRAERLVLLRELRPTPVELLALRRAAARYGLSDPTPDDVLAPVIAGRPARERCGMLSLCVLMVSER